MKIINYIIYCVLLLLPSLLNGQAVFTNAGANIQIFGTTGGASHLDLVIIGDYENQTDINSNDGIVDLANSANIFITGNWLNNSFSNVFLPTSTSLDDGFVTFQNNTVNQLIGGVSPTFFENIVVVGTRKILSNNNNSINGSLILDAPLDLNSNTFEIKNNSSNAIAYSSGFIKSETLPGATGYIKWNIGNAVANFSIPFGSDGASQSDDLRLDINIKNPMSISDYFLFATYPTDMYNQPMPNGASPLETEVRKVVDRYWLLEPSDINHIPNLDIVFSYSSNDISKNYNSINPDLLFASRNNTTLGKWLDMDPRGYNYLNKVEIKNVLPSEFFSSWTLLNTPPALEDLFVPTAFTPDGDGLNDVFLPTFQVDFEVIDYEMIIFNRWGETVFVSKDKDIGWDGHISGNSADPQIGVYSWVILLKGRSYGSAVEGVRKKFTGMVTLFL